ncbi:hypothetical protein ACFX1Z_036643 [Malus domestica]
MFLLCILYFTWRCQSSIGVSDHVFLSGVHFSLPLVFPDMKHVAVGCGNGISNRTACCTAMESYVAHLQKQSLITNVQALDCAASLGIKLRKSNIIEDVYSLCHISLKDFSLQG